MEDLPKAESVRLERKTTTTEDGEQEMSWNISRRTMKRFHHPYTIFAECPICGSEAKHNRYLSYPKFNEPEEVLFECHPCPEGIKERGDERCTEFRASVEVSVDLKVPEERV